MNGSKKRRRNKPAQQMGKQPSHQRAIDTQQALDAAVKNHSAGNLAQAERMYKQILKIDQNHPIALNLLGVVSHQKGNNEAALDYLIKATTIFPDYPDGLNNLGVVYKELGKLEQAVESYTKAIAIKQDYIDAYNNRGAALELLGQNRKSILSYQCAHIYRTGIQPKGDVQLAPATGTLYIELTNKCNFHCDFCPSDSQKRALGFIDLDLVKRSYDEAAQKKLASSVALHLMGEPTLHPKLIEVLKHGSSVNIETELVTNGSTLVPKVVPAILDSLYGTLEVSHMTPTEGTYKFRGAAGISWERYLANIQYVVREYLKRLKNGQKDRCDIVLRIMVSKDTAANVSILDTDDEVGTILTEWIDFVAGVENELGMPAFKRLSQSIDDLRLDGGHKFRKYRLQKGISIQFWEAFTFANTRVDEDYELQPIEETAFCKHPFRDFAVLWNGDVTLCCLDYDGQLKIGNVKDSSIEDMMYGEAAAKLRASMLGQGSLHSYCQTCQERPVMRETKTSDSKQ